MEREKKWDLRFLNLAELVSTWSKDPSTKVGAVITDSQNKILSIGYNGLPMYNEDAESILNNREEKYKYIIHAEMNAVLTYNGSLEGCKVYTYPFLPCTNCASMLIQAGIIEVVSFECINSKWVDRINDSKKFFEQARVSVKEYKLMYK